MKIKQFFCALLLVASFIFTIPCLAESKTSQAGISFTGNGSIEVSVTLQKQDKDTKALLSGATFELHDESGQNVAVDESLTTDDKGEIYLDRLQPGKYTFVEIKSPKGYQLDTTPIPFDVSFDQTEATVIAYNQKVPDSQVSANKTEQPKNQSFLPNTGMLSATTYIFLGLLLLIGALYLFYRHQKTK